VRLAEVAVAHTRAADFPPVDPGPAASLREGLKAATGLDRS
jgi:hypothetical protein